MEANKGKSAVKPQRKETPAMPVTSVYEQKIDKQIDAKKKEKAPATEDQIKQRVKARNSLSAEIQTLVDELALKTSTLIEHDLDTYSMLHGPDALYGDCPLGKPFIWSYLKQYMIKKDMDFVGYHLDGKFYIQEFRDRMVEASNWALRFTKPLAKQKTGINAIIGDTDGSSSSGPVSTVSRAGGGTASSPV